VDEAAERVHVARAGGVLDDAGLEEQQRLGDAVVEGVVEAGEQQEGAERPLPIGGEDHAAAERGHDDADVLDARVGEEALEVALHQPVQDSEHRREDAEGHRQQAPPGRAAALEFEAEERDPENAELDHKPGEEGGAVGGRGRVRLRQPDVQRDEAGLEAEAHQGGDEGGVAPGGRDGVGAGSDLGQVERAGVGGEDHEGGDDQREPGFAEGEEEEGGAGDAFAAVVAEDDEIGEERHRLPGDEEDDRVAGDEHGKRGEERQVEDGQIPGAAVTRPVVAGHVEADRERDQSEQCDEDRGERVEPHRHRPDEVAGADRTRRAGAVDRDQAAANERAHAAERGDERRERQHAATLGERAEGGGGKPERGGGEERDRGDVGHARTSSRRSKRSACTFSSSRPTATSRPCRRASGLGGQPGTYTSTGMTASTRPCTSSSSAKTPPSAQAPTATTMLGSGIASSVFFSAGSAARTAGPLTRSRSACRGAGVKKKPSRCRS